MRHTYRLLDRPAFVRFQLVSSLGLGVRRMTRSVLLGLGLAGTAALFAPAGTLDTLISTPLGGGVTYRALLTLGLLTSLVWFLPRLSAALHWPDGWSVDAYSPFLFLGLLLRAAFFPADQAPDLVRAALEITAGWTLAQLVFQLWEGRQQGRGVAG